MQLETMRKDMVAAMKAHDKVRKEAVSSLISAVKKAAIDAGCRDDIPESMVDQVILKELKTVKEQVDTCPDSRQDLKEEYQARYNIIQEYAPKLLTEDGSGRKVFGSSVHKKQGTDYEGCHGRTERKSRRQSDQSGRCQTVPVRFWNRYGRRKWEMW